MAKAYIGFIHRLYGGDDKEAGTIPGIVQTSGTLHPGDNIDITSPPADQDHVTYSESKILLTSTPTHLLVDGWTATDPNVNQAGHGFGVWKVIS